jgi:hypothetical protein
MSFPDLQLVPDTYKGPGFFLPYVAEVTGVPDAGNNTFLLPFVDNDVPPSLIIPERLRIFVDPDPNRPAGGTSNPGVSDVRFVSLSADKRNLTLDFAQSGAGDVRIHVSLDHTIEGEGGNTPIVEIASPVGGGGPPPPTGIVVTLGAVGGTTFEIGDQSVNPAFNMSESGVTPPITVRTLADNDGNPTQNVLGLPNPLTMPFSYQKNPIGSTVQFTGAATDSAPSSDSDVVTFTWRPRVWYGLSVNPALTTEAQIEALANSALQSNKGLTYNVVGAANEYVYYAWPQVYGAFAPLDFQIGPFPGGFIDQLSGGTVNLTANTPGAPTNAYVLARSTNPLTGNFTVNVAP